MDEQDLHDTTFFALRRPWPAGNSAGNLAQQLQDLYLNDNNLEGSIPERMVVNCECLQRLYLGGNRLTGTVPRYLRHVRDLRELNIERNNLHGEVPTRGVVLIGRRFAPAPRCCVIVR